MMFPWQECTVGSGLMLHAPLNVTLDIAAMRSEFAALDASLAPEHRTCFGGDGTWTAISLMNRPMIHRQHESDGSPTPILDKMPSVRALLERFGCTVLSCHISRQSPGGSLAWHYDDQALHLPESRFLVPLHIPQEARTFIGHEAVAYPEGVVWTGDFSFPHMVDNPSSDQRIVLLIDILNNDWARGRAPDAMSAELPRRESLSAQAQNAWIGWPGRQDAYRGATVAAGG